MNGFNTNRNAFTSTIQLLKNDLHAFASLGIPKGSKNAKQQKTALASKVSSLVDTIETEDVGIRILIMKTKD